MTTDGPEEAVLTIAADTFICSDFVRQGRITFGSGCIVHPKAIIRAGTGSIVFGCNNIVEETALIENL